MTESEFSRRAGIIEAETRRLEAEELLRHAEAVANIHITGSTKLRALIKTMRQEERRQRLRVIDGGSNGV